MTKSSILIIFNSKPQHISHFNSHWYKPLTMQELFNDSEPLKDRLLRNGFRMYLLSFIIAPAWYLIKLMVSRSLSVEDVGLVYSIIGFIWLLSAFNDLWLTEALQYYLPQYIIDKEYGKVKTILIITWIVQFIWWIIIWGWLYFAAPRMAEHYFHSIQATEILRLFCLYFLFINLFQVLQSVFIALQNIKLQYGTEAVRIWCVVMWSAYFFFQKWLNTYNVWVLRLIGAFIWVITAIILFFLYYSSIWRKWSVEFDNNLLKVQWSYAWKIMIAMQVSMIYSNIGQQFAIGFLGTYEAGIWTNYMTFFTAVWVIIWPILGYLFPLLTELYKKKEEVKIQLMKKYLNRWLVICSIVLAIGGRYFSERAAIFLFGDKFLMSWTLFKRYALFFYFFLASTIQQTILAWAGYVNERVKIIIFWTIFSLILSYFWVLNFGLYGLMWSSALTHVYFWVHSLFYIKKFKI